MPFKGVDVMDVKKEFVLKSLDDRVVFTETTRKFKNLNGWQKMEKMFK